MNRDTATYGEKPRFDFCVNQVENQTGVHFMKIYHDDHDRQHDYILFFHVACYYYYYYDKRSKKYGEVFDKIVRCVNPSLKLMYD